MSSLLKKITRHLLSILLISLIGCASVPKEVVELSYTVGKDLQTLHLSYKDLVTEHFQSLRNYSLNFLEKQWKPKFIKRFIEDGGLIESAKGSDPNIVLEDVELWAEVAIGTIEEKKNELLDPIDKDEKELLTSVDASFSQLIQANSTITAHLNSIREVTEVQDEALKALKLDDLRDKINNMLALASDKSKEAIDKFAKAEGIITELNERKEELIKKVKGE